MNEMSDHVLVSVENLSKRFCRSFKRSLWYGLQDLGSEIGGRRQTTESSLSLTSADVQLRKDEFWAVHNVNFTLSRGECVSVIGQNGAGKTTLLKLINGLVKPDEGRIQVRGTVGALIALGAGFNPILTGRENIQIQASILGINSRQIRKSIDEIIDFAGIEKFIDSPVQSYSSGMQVRLGFAIASHWFADILLLDEVLAVGDVNFRTKCYNRLAMLKEKGAAFLLVSHDMSAISQFSDRCIFLSKGRVKYVGHPSHAIALYESEAAPNVDQENFSSFIATPNVASVILSCYPYSRESLNGIWKLNNPSIIEISLSDEVDEVVTLSYIFRGRTLLGQPVSSKGSCKITPIFDSSMNCYKLVLTTSSVSLPPGSYTLKMGIWRNSFQLLALIESCPLSVEVDKTYQGENSHYQSFIIS